MLVRECVGVQVARFAWVGSPSLRPNAPLEHPALAASRPPNPLPVPTGGESIERIPLKAADATFLPPGWACWAALASVGGMDRRAFLVRTGVTIAATALANGIGRHAAIGRAEQLQD